MINKVLFAGIAAATLLSSVAYVLGMPGTEVSPSNSQPAVKGDRLDIHPFPATCSQQAWPHYNNACVRDHRRPAARAQQVRVVSVDRLSLAASTAR